MIFTYELWQLSSLQAHEYVTLEFVHGTIRIRSTDNLRCVSPTWDVIGTYTGDESNPRHVCLTEDSWATELATTYMRRNGTIVLGVSHTTQFGAINRLIASRRMTRPESIRGRIRDRTPGNPRDKRARVQRKYGRIGTANVAEMRAERDRILAERNAK